MIKLQKHHTYLNPKISKLDLDFRQSLCKDYHIFTFDRILNHGDSFLELRKYQSLISQKLLFDINPQIRENPDKQPVPEIGLHVRLSDFKSVTPEENRLNTPFVRTPLEWFVRVLQTIRYTIGYPVPATVFSDGYPHELLPLLELPQVSLAPPAPAIQDLILLSIK